MKRIEVISKPHKRDELKEKLTETGARGMTTLSEVIRIRTGESGPQAI